MHADIGRIVPDGVRVADLMRVDKGDPALLLEDFGTAELEQGAVGHVITLDVAALRCSAGSSMCTARRTAIGSTSES